MKRISKLFAVVAVLLGVGIFLKASLPQVWSGTWAPVAPMSSARAGASAVLLKDGRILITGGDAGSGALASADLFNTDGTISLAPPMNNVRSGHVSVVLQDGRVLVAGGTTSGGEAINAAEIYDPVANSWSLANTMVEARSAATASLLQDGRVLIAGGQNNGVTSSTVEIFDPAAGTFGFAGTLSSPRQNHAAALLADGRVLIVGGSNGSAPVASVDVYDPAAGSISVAASLNTPRQDHSATTMLDGRVLVAGGSTLGNNGTVDLASAEIYDPSANTFTAATGNLAAPRQGHLAFLLPHNNSVLITGGTSNGTAVASAELFIPWGGSNQSGVFQPTGSMGAARNGAAGSALGVDGLLLVAGGRDASGNALASTELYGFATVKTDALDYPPGTTVNITGSGWQPGETVMLTLVESPLIDTHGPFTAIADANGNISDSSFVTDAHDLFVTFSLSAVGSVSQAQTKFTDANSSVTCATNPVNVGSPTICTYSLGGNPSGNVTWTWNTTNTTDFTAASGTFVSPNQCTLSGGGTKTCAVTYTPTATGSQMITGTNAGGTANFTLTVNKANPTNAIASESPDPSAAGQSVTVGFSVTGVSGLPNPTGTVTVTITGSSATCTGTLTAGNPSTGSCSLSPTGKGAQTLTATYSGDGVYNSGTAATAAHNVNAGAATQLVFTTTPVTVTAGVASGTITVQRQDQFGNANTTDAARTVTLSSNSSGTVTFTPASPLSIPSGSSSASFTYTDTVAGTPTITAASTSPTMITSATQQETVNGAAATKLVFTTVPVTVTAGVASGTITVQRQDSFGNPNTTDATRTVTLSSSSGGTVTFTPASPLSIPSGSSSASFTYTDTKAGTPTITAASTSPTTVTSATQTETVNVAAATKLVFTTAPVTVAAGTTSGTITVQRQDQFGNANTTDAARTVTLSSNSSGTVTFNPASPLSIPTGSSSASFTYTDTAAGTPTITAASTSPTMITSATQQETVNGAAATKLVFTTTPVTVTAGVASGTITVQRQDQFGNANTTDAARTVTLSSNSSGTVTFTPASPLSIPSGSSSASFTYTDTAAGTPTITAASTSPTMITSATQQETVNGAAATKLVFTTVPVTVTAGVASGTITVQRQDQFGNANTTDATRTVTLSSNSSGTVTFNPASPLSIPTGSSSASFTYMDTKAGTPTITAASTSPTTITSTTQTETVNAATASKLAFTTSAFSVQAGACSSQVTVQTQDSFGNASNPSAAVGIALSSSSIGGTFYSNSGCTSSITTASISTSTNTATFFYEDTKAGSPVITAAATGGVTSSPTQTETVTAAAATKLVFTTAPVTVAAGVASTAITVQRQDQFGNANTTDATRTVTLSSSSSGTVTFTPASPLSIPSGSSSASFTYTDTAAGTPTITAASTSPTTITSATQTETVNAAAATKLVFTTAPVTVTAGVTSGTITVQRQDQFGNANTTDATRTVTLSSSSSGTVTFTPASPLSIPGGSSSASFTYTDTAAGTPTITAASTSPTMITSATQQETVNGAAATKLVFTTVPVTVTAGVASGTITVQRQDQFGNANTTDATRTVTLSSNSSGTVTFNPASPLSIPTGSSSASFTYMDTKAGTPTITAASTSPTTITSTTQTETVNAGALSKFVFAMIGTQTVGTPFNVTVTAEDANGNTVTSYSGDGDQVTLTVSSGTLVGSPVAVTFSSGVSSPLPNLTITTAESSVTMTATGNPGHASGISGMSNPFTVNQASTSTAVVSSQTPSAYGQSVTFTATVTDSSTGSTGTATGTVTFKDGSTTLGTGTLSALNPDTATFTTSSLSVPSHSITAVYGGDANFIGSTSSTLTQTVNQVTPTFTNLTASQTITYGTASVTLSGKLTGSPVNPPSGSVVSVTINGVQTSGTTSDAAGDFSISVSTSAIPASVTAYTITYGYAATTNFAAASDTSTKLTVNQATASISVTLYNVTYDGNPHTATGSATGVGSVNLSADLNLTGTTHTSAGTYATDPWTFHDASGNYADASGTVSDVIKQASASITVTPYSVPYDGNAHTATGSATGLGSVNLSADLNLTGTTHTSAGTYATDPWTFHDPTGNYADASGTVSDVIKQAFASITVTPYSVPYDGNAHTATGSATGLGRVNLSADLTLTGTTHTNAGTYASDPWSFHDPNGNYADASSTVSDVISQATSSVTVICPAAPQTYTGSAQTPCTASYSTSDNMSGLLTVSYTNNIDAGTAGANATYAGDSNHAGSSGSSSFTISQASTSTAVSSSENPSNYGDSVTFKATVSSGAGTPSGTVQFYVDGSSYESSVTLSGGTTSVATTSLLPGQHTITAVYSGSMDFTGNTSPFLTQTVTNALISIGVTPPTPTIFVGQTQQFTAIGRFGDGTAAILPTGGTWAVGNPLTTAVRAPMAATGSNSAIYFFGGQDSSTENFVQIYDPSSGVWSAGASMPTPRYQGTAAAPGDAKIYVIGGWNASLPTSVVEAYDPATNTWASKDSIGHLSACSVSGAINGKIYVVTGCNGNSGFFGLLDVYDPVANTWTNLPSAPNAHGAGAGGVINGKLYVVGGYNSSGSAPTATLDVYDPQSNTWSTMASMPNALGELSGGFANGKLYIVGGLDSHSIPQSSVYIYDPLANAWSAGPSISQGRRDIGVTALDGLVYAGGGYTASDSNLLETLNTDKVTWGSDNTPVATVDPNAGLATGVTPGSANISAASTMFPAATGSTLLTVQNAHTTTTVTSSENPSTYGDSVTFTATVAPQQTGLPTPTGTVQFVIDGTNFGSPVTLTGGTATSGSTSTLMVAGSPHSIEAVYTSASGSVYLGSTGTLMQTVNPATLTITARSTSKNYGVALTFAGTEFTASMLYNRDTVTSVTLTSAGAAATATVTPPGPTYPIVPSAAVGTGLGNYTITYVSGTLTVNPAALTVTAKDASKIYGVALTFAGTEFTNSALSNSDTITSVTLTSAGAAAAATVTPPGPTYSIVPSAAVGSGLGNYTISYVNGTLTVNPATPTVTVTDPMPTYDTNPHSATATAIGVDGHTAVTGSFGFTYDGSGTAPTNAKTSYAVVATFASSDGNYTGATGNGFLTIKQATPTVMMTDPTPTYDANPHTATATAKGVNNAAVTGSFSFTYDGSGTAPTNAKTSYAVVATFTSSDPNYTGATGDGFLTIKQATPLVTVSGGPFTYDGNPHPATVVAIGVNSYVVPGTFVVTYTPPGNTTIPVNAKAYSVSAAFSSSDSNYTGSVGAGSIAINPAATSTSVTSSLNPSNYGDPVTFTAVVTNTSTGATPTGTLALTVDGSPVTATISSSGNMLTATYTTAALMVSGSPHSVAATYSNSDGNFSGSSGSLSPGQTVNQATTGATISSSASSTVLGEAVTFTATIADTSSGSTGTPTGIVNFYDGAVLIGSGTLNQVVGSDQASFTTALLSDPVSHSITAIYRGDSNFSASPSSSAITQTVTMRPTSTAVALSPTTVAVGISSTATVTVTDTATTGPSGTPGFFAPVVGSLNTPRTGQAAVLLPNGTVLLIGGEDSSGNALFSMEIYDPSTSAFTLQGKIPSGKGKASTKTPNCFTSPCMGATATLLSDGTVLVVGGSSDGTPAGATLGAAIYDPETNSYTSIGVLNTPRFNHTATLLSAGNILIAGGEDSTGTALSSTEIYTPSTQLFAPGPGALSVPRAGLTSTLLPSGKILMAGGSGLKTAELYDPNTGMSVPTLGNMSVDRTNHTATLLLDGNVLMGGGTSSGTAVNTIEIYNTAVGTFTSVASTLTTARSGQTATMLDDGHVLMVGGTDASTPTPLVLGSAETYTPSFDPLGTVPVTSSDINDMISGTCTLTLTGTGSTTCTSSVTPPHVDTNPHVISGAYSADNVHSASSGSANLTVIKATPTFTNLTASQTIVYGTPSISLSGTISASCGTGCSVYPPNTETVSITINGVSVTPTISSNGSFSTTFDTLELGVANSPYTITYNYATDADFNSATDGSTQLTVIKATPTFSNLTASQTIPYGTGTITVSGRLMAPTATPPNADSVTVSINGTPVTQTVPLSGGAFTATLNTAAIAASTTPYVISYSFTGDSNFNAASDVSTALTVIKATPTFSNLTASQTIPYGTGTITVSGKLMAPTATPPNADSVTVSINGTPVTQTVPLSGGAFTATLNTAAIAASTTPYVISYSFTGDSNFNAASDVSTALTVIKATPTFSNLTASQTIPYGTGTITVSGKLMAPTATPPNADSVTVSINGTPVTQTVSLSGGAFTATLSTSAIAASTTPYVISYSFTGDSNFNTASDVSTALTVIKATPTFSNLTASQTIPYGTGTITVSGKLMAPTATPPNADSVTVSINGTPVTQTVPLSGGAFTATLSTSAIAASTTPYVISYSFTGDSNFNTASDVSTALTVIKATPTFSNLTASQTIPYGTGTITVSGKLMAPTATPPNADSVTVSINGTPVTQTVPLSGGAFTATLSASAIAASTTPYVISYSFTGDSNFNTASDASTSLTVNKADTSSVVTSNNNPSIYGQSVTFTATVLDISLNSTGTPTGSVTFMDGATTLAAGVALSAGHATFTTSTLVAATHSITAVYSGDSNFNGSGTGASTDPAPSQIVNPAPLTITASSGSMIYGGPVFPVTPSNYSVFVNGDTPASLTTQPSCGTYATSSTPVGTYASFCTGAVDSNYTISYSTGIVTVIQATTATKVTSSLNPSIFMQAVTFTATVTPQYPGTTPTGGVDFYDAASGATCATLGSSTQVGTAPTLSGGPGPVSTSVTTASLSGAPHNILACYSGDANFYSSAAEGSSTAIIQTVTPAPLVKVSPLSITFTGQNVGTTSNPFNVTVTNVGDATLVFQGNSPAIMGAEFAVYTKGTTCGASLAANNSCTIAVKFSPTDTGIANATLQMFDNDDNQSGAEQDVVLTGAGLSTVSGGSLYTNAIFAQANGCGSITLSGGSSVDSFNSGLGYNASDANTGGNVATNGNITLSGNNTEIHGTAAVDSMATGSCNKAAATGLTSNGGAQVSGGLVPLNGPITYPLPPVPNPAPPTTNENISGSCPSGMTGCANTGSKTVSLAPGQYGNVNVSGGTTAHFSQGTYNINSLTLSGKSILYVDSGPVIINLAGASLSGASPAMDLTGGSIENPSWIPINLQFLYAGSRGISFSGGSGSYATVYAPNAFVNMSGGTDFYGSIIGSTVTGSGGTGLHYDTALPNIPAGDYIWLTAVVNNVKGLTSSQAKLYLTNSSITYTVPSGPNAGTFTVPVPNAVVTFNSVTQTSGAKTTYDLTNSRWSTAVAASALTGNTFVTGVAVPVPAGGFPGGIQNVQWSSAFSTDTTGITLEWQWSAAVYSQFSTTYATTTPSVNTNVLGVNPEDGSVNSTDPAGTPETFKAHVTAGGTGGGGTNYTGYLVDGAGIVPTAAEMSVSPSTFLFGTQTLDMPTAITQVAVLTNNDGITHTISTITVSGPNMPDFVLQLGGDNNCVGMSSLAAGNSCNLFVVFTPSYTVPETGKIVVNDNANNSPQTLYLSGTGQ